MNEERQIEEMLRKDNESEAADIIREKSKTRDKLPYYSQILKDGRVLTLFKKGFVNKTRVEISTLDRSRISQYTVDGIVRKGYQFG